MVIADNFNQDSVVEAMVVKRLIEESAININLDRVQAYKHIRGSFE